MIDDDLLYRNLVADFLRKAGYRVAIAGDGIKALELYAENEGKFDLVICDFAMSGMEVIQIHERIKRVGPVPKFLICSGSVKAYQNTELLAAGITDYLRKPFTMPELLETVARVLLTRQAR